MEILSRIFISHAKKKNCDIIKDMYIIKSSMLNSSKNHHDKARFQEKIDKHY